MEMEILTKSIQNYLMHLFKHKNTEFLQDDKKISFIISLTLDFFIPYIKKRNFTRKSRKNII